MASHYRAAIFKLIDEEYDCDWYYGKSQVGIKDLPLDFFKHAKHVRLKPFIKRPFYWQEGEVRQLRDKQYDVVIATGDIMSASLWWGMIVRKLSFCRKPKVFYWTHGMLHRRSWPRRWMEKLYYSMPDGLFVYGDRAKAVMVREGINENKLHVIHNSLDYDQQVALRGNFTSIYTDHFQNTNPVLFFIGRLTAVKKLDMLLTAAQILNENGCAVNLAFIGDGPEKESLQKQSKELGLEGKVWFYGPCYNEKEKSELITNADVCVAPGNVGLTAIDSLMYGTPVITMNNYNTQMPEHEAIKEGVTGSFFKENNVQDLADKISIWLNKRVYREGIRESCYREIDESWNPHFQMKVIKSVLRDA